MLTYLATLLVRVLLTTLNLSYRRKHGNAIPPEFGEEVDVSTLPKVFAYNADRERFGVVRMLLVAGVVLWFLFGGGLGVYDGLVANCVRSPLWRGVVFFLGLHILTSLLDVPFDLYSTFHIEERHGFNRTTLGLYVADWIKGMLLGSVLVAAISTAGLLLYQSSPHWYWLWFWGFAVALAMLLMLIAPAVIEPLFIKTAPLENAELVVAVRELAERAGVQVTNVLQVDASRRSAHSNAYFTGIGRVKRVVLFDTLLERLSDAEVLAVLGHELGHWKLRHVTTRLLVSAFSALLMLYAAASLLSSRGFATSLGLEHASLPARIVMMAFVASILGFLITPVSAAWSRVHEAQADSFAVRLVGQGRDLATALVKLARDNLSNLHPHPWYAAFYYSHPPTHLRVQALLKLDSVVSSG